MLNQINWVVILPFTNKVFKYFSICLCYSFMLSYVYHVLDSMLCLINRSLSYALISCCLLSVCKYSSSRLSTERSDRVGQEDKEQEKATGSILCLLFNLFVIGKVENALRCCSRLSY